MSTGLRRATAAAPPRSRAVETSCHRGRAPLRQTLAVAPRRPAARQRRLLHCPWHTPRAEIVRLGGVPINGVGGERLGDGDPPAADLPPVAFHATASVS